MKNKSLKMLGSEILQEQHAYLFKLNYEQIAMSNILPVIKNPIYYILKTRLSNYEHY